MAVTSDTSAGADTIVTALGSSATATAIVDANIATSFDVTASSRAAHIVCCTTPSSCALNLYPQVAPWMYYTLKVRPKTVRGVSRI